MTDLSDYKRIVSEPHARAQAARIAELKGRLAAVEAERDEWRRFTANATEARDNGYDLICAECGVGVTDDSDMHDRGCSLWTPLTA